MAAKGCVRWEARALTPAERRSLISLGSALAPAIATAWAEVAKFSPSIDDAGHAVPAPANLDETLAVQEFTADRR